MRLHRVLPAVAVLLIGMGAGGCGSTTVVVYKTITTTPLASATAAPSESVTPTDGDALADTAGLGDTLKLTGHDPGDSSAIEIAVTPTKMLRLPAVSSGGTEMHPALFGVLLTIENVGNSLYDEYVPMTVAVVDAKDRSHEGSGSYLDESGNELADRLGNVRIAPGDKRTGWVFFALDREQEPRLLQYTPYGGNGIDYEVGEWSLK